MPLRTSRQRFSDFDITFALANVDEFGLSPAIAECKSTFYWPNLIFFGFHPDITYFGIQGKPVRSAMGEYNSRIAATGYALGLSVRETCRLFDKDVYDRLEFFDKYPISRAGLLVAAENCGLDLSDALHRGSAPAFSCIPSTTRNSSYSPIYPRLCYDSRMWNSIRTFPSPTFSRTFSPMAAYGLSIRPLPKRSAFRLNDVATPQALRT